MSKLKIQAAIVAFLCLFMVVFDSVSRVMSTVIEGCIAAVIFGVLYLMIKGDKKES